MGIFRLLLAVCVLFGHSAPLGHFNWLNATTAVEVFFVISGFYMQMILREKYTAERLGSRWKQAFYAARYFRLFPAYFAVLVLTLLALLGTSILAHKATFPIPVWQEFAELDATPRNVLLWIWMLASNLTMLLLDIGGVLAIRSGEAVFTLDRNASDIYIWSAMVVPQAWSLGVELLFYLLAPFILLRRHLWAIFVVLLTVKLIGIRFLVDDLPYRMFPFVLVHFVGGALMYRYRKNFSGRYWMILGYVLMAVIVLGLPILGFAQSSMLCMGLTMIAVPALFESTKTSRIQSLIGELSYPFYIFHYLIYLSFLYLLRGGVTTELIPTSTREIITIGTLLVTLIVSYVVMRLEFRYLEPWRQRFRKVSGQ